jgi:hypothetical protein
MSGSVGWRAVVGALLVVVAGVTSACAAGTVDGHGSAAASAAAPSAPSSSAPSTTAPSTSAGASTPILPPLSTVAPSGGNTPVSGGVEVTDTAGHFRVVMPAEPQRTSEPGSFGNYKFNVHVAAVNDPYVVLVEGESITPALTSDAFTQVLDSAVSSFQTSSGLTLVSQSDTTFEGHQGRQAVLRRGATRYVFLIFVFSGSQVYALFAPEGSKFDALAASFQAI